MLKATISKNTVIYFLLGIILLVHAVIITKLIYFPYPELFIYPYLTNHGLKPYSQILDQHFPGLMFLPVNFDNLGMNTPEVARLWSIAIILITHLMLFFISSKIFKSKFKAILVNVLYLVWQPFFEGWVLWIDNFLPLLLLPGFYFFYNKRLFICGLILGLAISFKQTVIPLSILVLIYTFWTTHDVKKTARFLLGMLIPILLMAGYLIGIGVLSDFWYWTVVFNLTTYAQFGTKAPPSFGFITRVVLVYIASVLGLLGKQRKVMYILLIFMVGSLLGAFERGDFVHFQPSLPFALIATVFGFSALWDRRIGRLIILIYILIGAWWLNIFYRGHISSQIISFDPQTKTIASKIRQYTHPKDKIFVFGAATHLYQMSDTLPAGDIFVYQFPWFLRVAEDRILEGIKKDKPEIIVSERSVTIEGARIIDYAANIDQYINQHYQKIDNVGTTDILRRKS